MAPGRCPSASSHKCEISRHQNYAEMDFCFRNGALSSSASLASLGRLREERHRHRSSGRRHR